MGKSVLAALMRAASLSSALGQTLTLTMTGQGEARVAPMAAGEENVTATVSIVWILQ